MLRKLPLRRRVWLFLLALLTLGGMCWADTFDLSDDIPLSQNTVEQALQPEEVNEQVLLLLELSAQAVRVVAPVAPSAQDRKSTRLNSSHGYISYAVFCLKKKKQKTKRDL